MDDYGGEYGNEWDNYGQEDDGWGDSQIKDVG